MSIDEKTVARVANLARIKVSAEELPALAEELNGILSWIEQLEEVDTQHVLPFFEDATGHFIARKDEINDGGYAEAVLRNAPEGAHGFFTVPKVVE